MSGRLARHVGVGEGEWMVGGWQVFQTKKQHQQHNLRVPVQNENVKPLVQNY